MDETLLRLPKEVLGFVHQQGSLHYTPEHCPLNGGVNLYFGVEKATCFKWQGKMEIF